MDVNGNTAGFGDFSLATYQWSTGEGGPNIWTTASGGTATPQSYFALGGASTVILDKAGTSANHTIELQQDITLNSLILKGGPETILSGATSGTVLTLSSLDLSEATTVPNFRIGTNLRLDGAITVTSAIVGRNINLGGSYIGSGITLNGGTLFGTNLNTNVHFGATHSRVQNNSGGVVVGSISGNGEILTYYSGTTGSAVTVNQTIAGVFSGNIRKSADGSGLMRFVKQGTETLTLTGTNTYDGATSVNAGTLLINTALTNTPSVTVSSAARVGGNGETRNVIVQNGGRLGGEGVLDDLTVENLTLEGGAIFALDLEFIDSATVHFDTYDIGGTLLLAANDTVALSLTSLNGALALDSGTVLTLASYTGPRTGGLLTFGADVLNEGDSFLYGMNSFRINYGNAGGNSAITLTAFAIPEPSTLATLGFGGALLFFYQRRRMGRR